MNTKFVAESTHTLKVNHGTLLRKSGVAVPKASTPKKRTSGIPKPPTPADLRDKIAIADSKKRRKLGTLAKQGRAIIFGEQELESDSDSQPLATRRAGGKLPLAQLPEMQAEPSEERAETVREGRFVTELATTKKSRECSTKRRARRQREQRAVIAGRRSERQNKGWSRIRLGK